jgi:hypothetical protein
MLPGGDCRYQIQKATDDMLDIIRMLRLLLLMVLIQVAGCADLDRAVYEQGQYNSQRCTGYGLWPGSGAYSNCMTQGANYRPPSGFGSPGFFGAPDRQDKLCQVSSKTTTTGDAFNSTTKTSSSSYCY